MKLHNLRTMLAALAGIVSTSWMPSASSQTQALTQPCTCTNASLISTQATINFASWNQPWTGAVTTTAEIYPNMPLPTPTWQNPDRYTIDIQAQKLRIEFARDATYGPGANLKFSLNPTAPAPCGAAKIVGASFTTNRADAAPTITSSSSFGTPANTVNVVYGNQGLFADWRKGDWIEVPLKFDCFSPISMPPHSVTVLTPGPVNACKPYELCFDVNVPTGPLPGKSDLSLQLYQNGNPIGAPLTHTMTADGKWCFPMPAITPGQGFDYVLTTTHTYGFKSTVNSVVLTDVEIDALPKLGTPGLHQGQQQGFNNDLVCDGPPPTGSTCCPPMNNTTISGLFGHSGNSGNTYTEQFGGGAQGPANVAAFISNYNAYLTILKWSCPNVASLQVTFSLYQTNALGGAFSGTPIATNALTFNGSSSPVGSTTFFNAALSNNQFYGIQAITTPLGANGQPVKCGFDGKCLADDRFTWIHSIGAKVAGPGGTLGK